MKKTKTAAMSENEEETTQTKKASVKKTDAKKTKKEEFICAPWYGDYDRCDRGCGGTCLFLCRETKLS